MRAFLKENSIGTLVHYPVPVHLQPAYRGRVAIDGAGLERTEDACREILSLPMHPQMIDEQSERVCSSVVRWHARAPGDH